MMNRISNKALIAAMVLVIGLAAFCFINGEKLSRVYHVLHLFDEDRIVANFRTMDQHFPSKSLVASSSPHVFEKGKSIELPETFQLDSFEMNTTAFLNGSKTTGLLIIKNNQIVFEEYYLGNKAEIANTSWSMAKSFVATLIGIAHDDGLIYLYQTAETYAPQLIGSAYEGVTVKNILEMSSGVAFNEDYGAFFSDINKWGRAFAWGTSQDDFVQTLSKARPQGVFNQYVSIDTHVLSMILRGATRKSLTAYMQEKLWSPLGMEFDAYWATDDQGTEVALCGLNATLRDYGKLGTLYLNKGSWNGRQIVSEAWIKAAVTPSAPHLVPGKDNPHSAHELGYGFQWWIPEGTDGEFLAQGVYNQNIYVNPTSKLVIVKLSANDRFTDEDYIPSTWQAALAFYREVSRSF